MIHPHTRLQYINDHIGYGVFATQLIPQGSIVYIKDSLEVEIWPGDYTTHSPVMQQQIEKYAYMDERGVYILSWDFAKYVNHCCNSNTLSCSYGFDVAIRDISRGEEITCDYGTLNVEEEMPLVCSKSDCRGVLKPADFENYYKAWDIKIKLALACFQKVHQPLLQFVEPNKMEALLNFLKDNSQYQSVIQLKFYPPVITTPARTQKSKEQQ